MAIRCRHCGAVGEHISVKCPLIQMPASPSIFENWKQRPSKALGSAQYVPLVQSVDPAWKSTVRDVHCLEYVNWLKGPHDLVVRELANLEAACTQLRGDIELHGAVKELMYAGWLHGPYVHDSEAPKAEWKKYTLKAQKQEDGRICFTWKEMKIKFEDTTGQLRILNAKKNFFTEATPGDNQLEHVTTAVGDSREWKQRPQNCPLSKLEVAKRILEIFPEVEYRREGKVKIFIGSGRGKRQRDSDVYMFIKDELCAAAENLSVQVATSHTVEGSLEHADPLSSVCMTQERFALSDYVRSVNIVCLSRHPEAARLAILSSELAVQAQSSVVTEPGWANGAKVFVPMSAEDLPEDIQLRPYHVILYEEDMPLLEAALQSMSCKQRPRVKSTHSFEVRECYDHRPFAVEAELQVVHTFMLIPEEAWITRRSNCTRSLDDVRDGHLNPRTFSSSLLELYIRMKHCQRRSDLSGAFQCFSSISKECAAPNAHVFTMLIDTCVKAGELSQAEHWMETMKAKGVSPSRVTFNCLINGYANQRNAVGAATWFEAMRDTGLKPDLVTYKCMLRAFAAEGCLQQAVELFQEAKRELHTLDTAAYMIMMGLYGREGLPGEVEACFAELNDTACFAGLKGTGSGKRDAFRRVIVAYANIGDLAKVKEWCQKAEGADFAPRVFEYTQLLRACGPTNDKPANPEDGEEIFLQQVANGIAPDRDNLDALAEALGRSACNHLLKELHIHTVAARLPWWPDSRNFIKPPFLARQKLSLASASVPKHEES